MSKAHSMLFTATTGATTTHWELQQQPQAGINSGHDSVVKDLTHSWHG
jgi:hypothetical protein